MIIAVDGPAGAGKSTVAREVARRLAFLYIDTGAMYRAMTLKALEAGIDLNDSPVVARMAQETCLHLDNDKDGCLRIFMNGKDVTREIRQPCITRSVSFVARISGVRQVMLVIQRRIGEEKKDVVLDGRDIGTVVFPDAGKKFYLDADLEERVRRRHKEMVEAGQALTRKDVEDDLKNRDLIDSTRECAPLKKAEDAIYIDTTQMSISQVTERILSFIHG